MEFTINQIAGMLKGEVQGDGHLKINMLGKIQDAKQGQIAFLANPKYEQFIYSTQASAVIVRKDFQAKKDRYPDGGRADHNDHWPFLRRNNPFDSVWNACTIDRTLGHGSRYTGTSGCRVESFADELVWRKFRQRRN